MIMCNDTLTLFYGEYKQGVTTWNKRVLHKCFLNTNKAYLHTKLGVDSKYNSKIVLTDLYYFMHPKEWKLSHGILKDEFWTIGVSDKDFVCVGEVVETITDTATEKLIKEKYEHYTIKSIDLKRDFSHRLHRIECLGV